MCQKFFTFDAKKSNPYSDLALNPESQTVPESRTSWLRLSSWALYDFANTIFSAVVLTVYFPLYLTSLSGSRALLGAATTGSMILAGLVTPWVGALSDKTGHTKRYLTASTLFCVLALGILSFFHRPGPLILFFIISCFFYHASLVFYNALLPVAAPPEKQGFASGLGTGLGYLGVVCALPVMNLVDKAAGMTGVFLTTGLLFILFSLPLFSFVPERRVEAPEPFRGKTFLVEWQQIFKTVRELPQNPKLLFFLCGNFFLVDAVNSVIFWLSVYTRDVFHPTQDQIILVLMGLNVSAFAAGILCGFLSDRFKSMHILILSAASLLTTLVLLTRPLSFPVFIGVCFVGGSFALSGVWTAGRKALLELVPSDQTGKYFGLYGLTTKISVLGSLFYGMAADVWGMREGLWVLVIPAAAGLLLLAWSSRLKAR